MSTLASRPIPTAVPDLPQPTRGPGSLAALGAGLRSQSWITYTILLLGLFLPGRLPTYSLIVLTLTLVFAIALTSLVVLTGYVGQVSLCQGSFMGLAAFLCAALMGHFGFSYWLAAPLTVAAVFLVGVAVGLPALRLRGLTLAIVTLSLALLADNFLFRDVPWLNNGGNYWVITRPTIFGVSLDEPGALFRVILVALVLTLIAVARLRNGRTGKSWFAMRDAEIAASTSGVPIVSMKLLGFGIAAAIAALAGVLYTIAVGSVGPEPFAFTASIQLLAIAVIAGVRSLPGALLGAFFYVVFPQFLLQYPTLVPLTSLILGAGLILQLIFAPQGIGGTLDQLAGRLFRGRAYAADAGLVADTRKEEKRATL